MPYPILSKAEAREFLLAAASATDGMNEALPLPEPRQADAGPDEDWGDLGTAIGAALENLLTEGPDSTSAHKGGDVDALAGPLVHDILPDHPALADSEFWMWLTLTHARDAVRLRYGAEADLKNFGIGSAGENYVYRLWLRAEIGYRPESADPYALARVGDVDFWRSHLFRQGYGAVRTFAHALIEYQFPESEDRKPRLKTKDIRELVKRLKRARSNLIYEVMTQARAASFIEAEWERYAAETA